MSFLDPLYKVVATLLVGIHTGLSKLPGLGSTGEAWVLAIILLTMAMRLALFPIFVKQIRTQRAMQVVQPKMKELQAKYKNDKEKLNQEMMALWKEAGANPLSGCLPMLLQIPIFIALFHTLREIKPIPNCTLPGGVDNVGCFKGVPGFSQQNVYSAAHAKLFGVPISASFTSSVDFLHSLGATQTSTRILCLVLTVLMGASTFITQRQLMARNTADPNSSMAQQQKILLYVFPVLFLFYGFRFPIGVLIYWLTTNVWSMVQQRVVIGRMDRTAAAAAGPAIGPAGPAPGAKPVQGKPGTTSGKPAAKAPPASPPPAPEKKPAGGNSKPGPKAPSGNGEVVLPPGGAIPASPGAAPRPSGTQRPPGRSKNRKKGRR